MNNYVSTEKSLKKWLKSKIKITMATVVGFLIAGTVTMGAEVSTETYVVDKDNKGVDSINVNVKGSNETIGTANGLYGIKSRDGAEGIFRGEQLEIKVTNTGNGYAIGAGSCVVPGGANTEKTNSKINLGNRDTRNINIDVDNKGWGVGLLAYRSSGVNVNNPASDASVVVDGENLVINVYSETEATGIHVQNGTTGSEGNASDHPVEVIIKSKNTIVNAETATGENEVGLTVLSQGKLEVEGDLEVNAKTALVTRGGSLTKINADGKHTVKLDGDIDFNYDYNTSKTTVDADVTLNLSNAESYLNGKISVTGDFSQEDDAKKLEVNSMKLGLSNGGTWNVTGDSFVNELTLDGGVINILKTEETGVSTLAEGISNEYYQGKNDGTTTLNIGNLTGKGGTVTVESAITDDKQLEVQEVVLNVEDTEGSNKPNLDLGLSGVNTDDLAENNISAEKALGELKNKVTGTGAENIDQTLFVDGGTLTGKVTAELDSTGNITNIQQAKETPTTAAIRDLTAINYLSWKQEMSSLSQRMGELRDSSAEHGVWARVYGGKVENGSQYDNEYQTYQVGYDKKYTVDNGRVYLGYLVSYTDGETDYSYGTGENYSVGAGIYATWMNNNGHYVDVLYKVSRLNNKFDMKDVEDVKGDYDTYGISLSAEYGKRFDITEKWFAEPSVGMHLGRLGDETYTTDGGIEISQDSIYTAEGRVGAAVGYKFSDKGNIYARTHVVKEFAGEVDTEYERNGAYNSTSEDFGDTWFEFGVGANYRFTENMNVYADIEKTGDSTVDTKWQANLGFRYEF